MGYCWRLVVMIGVFFPFVVWLASDWLSISNRRAFLGYWALFTAASLVVLLALDWDDLTGCLGF